MIKLNSHITSLSSFSPYKKEKDKKEHTCKKAQTKQHHPPSNRVDLMIRERRRKK